MGPMVFVTNKNDFHHEDRFNGEDFSFPPQEKVAVSVEAARHMFGFGLADKTNTLTRIGWAMKYDPATKRFEDNPEGIRWLQNFIFTQAVMTEAPVVKPEELLREESAGSEADDTLEIV